VCCQSPCSRDPNACDELAPPHVSSTPVEWQPSTLHAAVTIYSSKGERMYRGMSGAGVPRTYVSGCLMGDRLLITLIAASVESTALLA
jgi:hypothetical protein